jgi:hypothetical protein
MSCMQISAQHSIVLITSFLRMLYCLLTATPAGENGEAGLFHPTPLGWLLVHPVLVTTIVPIILIRAPTG